MAPLTGLRVLVTRPARQAETWCQMLRAEGAEVISIPLLELAPVSEPDQIRAIKNRILDFDLYQKAIFVSQNAVAHGMQWLEDYWPQLPTGIEYFAVGAATARALADFGIRARDAGGAMNSEALLEAEELKTERVADQRILIFRGLGGRPHLGEVLSERGAQVDYCELYRRLMPENAAERLREASFNSLPEASLQVVALHSGESLHNYQRALEQIASENRPVAEALANSALLVPGARVAQLARDLGFKKIIQAENATDTSMLAALKAARP